MIDIDIGWIPNSWPVCHVVQAGASGSGSMAIQVAKALGASVITTVSTPQKAELARRLGADEIIYYRQQNFADAARDWTQGDGVDVVIDNLGGSAMHDNLRATRWGGKIVNFGLVAGLETTLPNIYEFFRGQYQLIGSFMGSLEELKQGLQLVKAGKVKPVLDEALPLGKVREAHERIDKNQVAGNLVLLPWAKGVNPAPRRPAPPRTGHHVAATQPASRRATTWRSVAATGCYSSPANSPWKMGSSNTPARSAAT